VAENRRVNPKAFFGELKRRNVYKVAVAYFVAGWALSQGIAQVFPVFDVPNWAIRAIALLIIVGLPIALVLAWMFEFTPHGIKRTETANAMPATSRQNKHAWIYVVVIGGLVSIGLFFSWASDALFKAIDFYGLAVQLDPNFALAWARLSGAHALLYFLHNDTTAARRDAAKRALEIAQKLQPDSPETLLFLGYYQYWVLRDYGLAKSTFERVSKMLPGKSEVLYALGAVAEREGNWDQRIAYWERGWPSILGIRRY
jgi:tetratricopeptide (TPR) repeat protein